jgi:acyl dehydratase
MAADTDSLPVGARIAGGSRTITDAEVAFLPALMGAVNPLFHDEVSAAASPMGGRILYGPALLGIAVALTESYLRDRVIGLVEIERVRFRRPVRPGDTVTASLTVVELTARPGRSDALLRVHDEVTNQDEVLVLEFSRTILVRAPKGAADA